MKKIHFRYLIVNFFYNPGKRIELAGEIDYEPPKLIVMIKNTDVDFPIKIELLPLKEIKEENNA